MSKEETKEAQAPEKPKGYQGREHIYAARKENRDSRKPEDGEAISPINEQMAEALAAEARGEDITRGDFSIDTSEEEGPSEAEIRNAELEAAGEEADEETPSSDEGEAPDAEPKPIDTKAKDIDNESVGDELVEVVINGRASKVPAKEVEDAGGVNAYQMRRAAAFNLQESARILRKAHTKAAELAKAKQPSPQPGEATPSSDVSAEANSDGNDPDWMDDLYDGDVDKAKERYRKSQLKSQAQPAPAVEPEPEVKPPEELVEIESQVERERSRQIAEANQVAEEEFGEYVNDPRLKNIMFSYFEDLRADPVNETRELKYLVQEAGNWLRKFQADVKTPDSDEVDETIEKKIVRKRALPTESSAARKKPAPSRKRMPESDSQYIQRMRKARGLPPSA